MPSRDLTSEDLFSSRMMSMHSSTHSSQMNTVGPVMSLRTSCWLLPQKEQYRVFLLSPPPDFVISIFLALSPGRIGMDSHIPTRPTQFEHAPGSLIKN